MGLLQTVWQLLVLLWSILTCRRAESLQTLCQRASSSEGPFSPALIHRLVVVGEQASSENIGELQPVLTKHLDFLAQYRSELQALVRTKSTPYDQTNPEHEEQLRALWTALKRTPCPPPTKSKQWQEIGFQGENPATDFRGMGILGLGQLLHFAQSNDGKEARAALSLSNHPSYWFPFACVGINITAWLLKCFETNKLVVYFCLVGAADVETFDRLYSDSLRAFANYYVHAQPPDIMSFASIFGRFCKLLEESDFNFNALGLTNQQS